MATGKVYDEKAVSNLKDLISIQTKDFSDQENERKSKEWIVIFSIAVISTIALTLFYIKKK